MAGDSIICEWVKTDAKPCGRPANFTGFCRTHEILAQVGYKTPEREKSTKPKRKDKLQQTQYEVWADELDRELRLQGLKKTRSFKAKDFPQYIDGLRFETIDEYHEWQSDGGEDFLDLELDGVDRPYDKPRRSKNHGYYSYSAPNSKFKNREFEFDFTGYEYVPPPPPPPVIIEVGKWKRVDQLSHMRYMVLRATDELYYAVWVSLDLNLPARTDDVMAELVKMKLPLGVTEILGQRIHTSRGYKTYWDADDRFNTG